MRLASSPSSLCLTPVSQLIAWTAGNQFLRMAAKPTWKTFPSISPSRKFYNRQALAIEALQAHILRGKKLSFQNLSWLGLFGPVKSIFRNAKFTIAKKLKHFVKNVRKCCASSASWTKATKRMRSSHSMQAQNGTLRTSLVASKSWSGQKLKPKFSNSKVRRTNLSKIQSFRSKKFNKFSMKSG